MGDTTDYMKLWAKSDPWHPLWCHLLDVAAVCEALLPRFGGVPPLPDAWVVYLVALHDLGKADTLFQNKVGHDPATAHLVQTLRDAGLAMDVDGDRMRGFRHEARSAEWLRAHLLGLGWPESVVQVVGLAITGHHGDFQSCAVPDRLWARWEPLRQALARDTATTLGHEPARPAPDFSDENRNVMGVRLSALIVLSDWIASNHDLYDYRTLPQAGQSHAYLAAARALAKDVIAHLELAGGSAAPGGEQPLAFSAVWPRLQPRPTQTALGGLIQMGLAPGLVIIEAPMGEGKTEAAVHLKEEWSRQRGGAGAYLALPTQATSNQMRDRYANFLADRSPGQAPPRLIHGMAWLLDDDAPTHAPQTHGEDDDQEAARAREWFQNAKRALIAPEGVGTVDQALMAALNVRHGFLRLLGLATKVLVVDECHAYDTYMTTILCRMLAWCRVLGVPVILLSATLSRQQKACLVAAYTGGAALPPPLGADGREDYPLLTFAPLGGVPDTRPVPPAPEQERTVTLVRQPGTLEDFGRTAALAADLVRDGGCACVLVNTVRAAQEIFQELRRNAPPDTELFLFHARFRAERRQQIEQEVTGRFGKDPETGEVKNCRRPERAILVATQVVEQSLDVDFDVMLTQIAPVDLLLQRSGRLWRHERGDVRYGWQGPTLYLLTPEDGSLKFGPTEIVYKREALLRTLALLHGKAAFDLPTDFRRLIEGCYGDEPLPPGHPVPDEELAQARARREREDAHEEQQARTHLVPEPDPQAFTYAQGTDAVDEAEDGERASYFRARTRLGDETRTVLFLCDPETIRAFAKACRTTQENAADGNRRWSPGRKWLRAFFLQKANVPARWLTARPADGFEPFLQGEDTPRWLRRNAVLVMPGGEWRGVLPGRAGKPDTPVVLRDDPDLGLTFEPSAPAPDAPVDADAQ